MRVDVKVNTYLFLKSGFKFLFKISDKLGNSAIILVVFLAVADENVVFITRDEAAHLELELLQFKIFPFVFYTYH
jgi:hypothetical protein